MGSRVGEIQSEIVISEQGDGSQASSSHGQWGTEVNKKQEWVGFCLKIYEDANQLITDSGGELLRRTEPRLREILGGKFLEPRHMSFGPIHYGDVGLQMGETKKRSFAYTRIWWLKEADYIEVCSRVMENVNFLRQRYEISRDKWWTIYHQFREIFSEFPETLSPFHCDCIASWMFLVDGCALLSLIREWGWSCVIDPDIFLLENQLPSQLLFMLMPKPCGTEVNGEPDKINSFLIEICEQMWPTVFWPEVLHNNRDVEIENCKHLLHGLWCKVRPLFCLPPGYSVHSTYKWGRFHNIQHNIQELKGAGIKFKSMGINKLHFKKGWLFTELEIPKFVIDNKTATILSNLIAFEMDPDFSCKHEVTSYVGLLKSLVVNPSDIAELRSVGIIHNNLLTDEATFELLRGLDVIGLGLDVDFESGWNASSLCSSDIHYYLEEHKSRAKIASWLIEAARLYCKTPWTIIAVLAATIVIILTAIQAYFAIFPRKE